jgi:ABC-type Fe3+-hydroxamate transport system substrate-binding protein
VTETLLAWGITPVAVTRFCEHPELPSVGGTKNPDVTAIVELHPDLVVMCREENREQDAMALATAGVNVCDISPHTLADVGPELDRLATAVGVDEPDVAESNARLRAGPSLGLSAFVPIWRRPWMTINGDTYGSSVLASIGVDNVFERDGLGSEGDAARYPETTLDAVAARCPDVVLAPSEPYPFKERHFDELRKVAPVVAVDGKDLFWWGARSATAPPRLRDAISAALRG